PDEMWVYEPHHVGYARFGTKWHRIVANYGGGDLVVHPREAAQDEVDHKFCRSGCKKIRYVRKANWLLRQRDPDIKEEPRRPAPEQPPLKKRLLWLVAVLA